MSPTTERRFDVIIVDSTDPQGPGAVLFTREFYAACKRCMAPGGVMVTQNGVPFFQPDELISSVGMFKGLFADGACYVAAIPTYVGGHMAMGWAAKDKKLRQHPVRTIAARYKKAGSFKTKYWTPEVHVAAFALPRFIAEHVKSCEEAVSPHAEERRVSVRVSKHLPRARERAAILRGAATHGHLRMRAGDHSAFTPNIRSAFPCAMRAACSSGNCASHSR